MRSVFRVLDAQVTSGLRFGDQAVAMGLLKEADLFELLRVQSEMRTDFVDVLVRQGVVSREVLEAARTEFRRECADNDAVLDRNA